MVTHINDNEVSIFETNNVNDNVRRKRSSKQVEAIANRIMAKLNGNKDSWEFYCKVGNSSMSESLIEKQLEIAVTKGKNPKAYFTWLCKRFLNE